MIITKGRTEKTEENDMMCRYCKRLEELKQISDKEHAQVLNAWRNCVYRHEKLLKECLVYVPEDLFKKIVDELRKDFVL